MQQMTMMWDSVCVVVAIRPAEHSGTNVLQHAVMDAAFKYGLSDTFYKWMRVSSSDESFFAWNIAHPDILREILRKRKEGDIYFRSYYRPCNGISTVIPEGNYFQKIA
jgi:hypothetical protein